MAQSALFSTEKSILQEIQIPRLSARGIRILVKRDDLIHPVVSGNKWRKLKYNLEQAMHKKSAGIFTFGGAFSNHLVATAHACQQAVIPCVGFVRGDELSSDANETLQMCADLGMQLRFLSRASYAMRNDKQYIDSLRQEYPAYYSIPEGGANYYGLIGCQEIWGEIPYKIDHAFVAQGTTTTSCGLLSAKPAATRLHVIPVLKGFDAMREMTSLLRWFYMDDEITHEVVGEAVIHSDYHFGGYAQYDRELVQFMHEMHSEYDVPLDPIYTAKAFYGMLQVLAAPDYDNQTVMFYHSGGLQGGARIAQREGLEWYPSKG